MCLYFFSTKKDPWIKLDICSSNNHSNSATGHFSSCVGRKKTFCKQQTSLKITSLSELMEWYKQSACANNFYSNIFVETDVTLMFECAFLDSALLFAHLTWLVPEIDISSFRANTKTQRGQILVRQQGSSAPRDVCCNHTSCYREHVGKHGECVASGSNKRDALTAQERIIKFVHHTDECSHLHRR